MPTTYEGAWCASLDWLRIVEARGEIDAEDYHYVEDWCGLVDVANRHGDEYEGFSRLDPDDAWCLVIKSVSPRHDLLRPGDLIVTGDEDCVFLRHHLED